jgi:acyl-coenzyme A thioesterase PaaI-like protein
MLAVNHPNVVLARAEARFLAPVAVGETMVARARVVPSEDRAEGEARPGRPVVEAEVAVGERAVFAGTFRCAVPERHVLAGRGGASR